MNAPPAEMVHVAVSVAAQSPCLSQRGAVVFDKHVVTGFGCNDKPNGFTCDRTEHCKATCRVEAVHAEQIALLKAGRYAHGCDLLHVKVVDGALVPSGEPSCVECSKLMVAAGIDGVWLYHDDGWRKYAMREFHGRSLAYVRLRDSQTSWRRLFEGHHGRLCRILGIDGAGHTITDLLDVVERRINEASYRARRAPVRGLHD